MQQSFTIKEIRLHHMRMNLQTPFVTSFGSIQEKDFFIIEMIDTDGVIGWGESVAFTTPWYTEETFTTTKHVMEDFLIPLLFHTSVIHPDEISEKFQVVRRNNMAKAALEGAVWDLYAKRNRTSLSNALGGVRKSIDVGVSIGMQKSVQNLLHIIEQYAQEGYKRIKVKIKPGQDIDIIKEIRREFPTIPLMVDANSAYSLKDLNHLKEFDEYNLMMIEQPLAHDDFVEHAILQNELHTPICLDESIHSYTDVETAIKLRSCEIINIKPGRVGGLTEAIKMHNLCKKFNIPVWCGGMLEAGVGRAQNIALATLEQFTIPGDISSSKRYWQEDIINPEVEVHGGQINISEQSGIGYEVDRQLLKKYRVDYKIYKNEKGAVQKVNN